MNIINHDNEIISEALWDTSILQPVMLYHIHLCCNDSLFEIRLNQWLNISFSYIFDSLKSPKFRKILPEMVKIIQKIVASLSLFHIQVDGDRKTEAENRYDSSTLYDSYIYI